MRDDDGGASTGEDAPRGSPINPMMARLHRPPERRDWIERARLMKQLDHAVLRPVVLVVAPAGFGKTTVVTQWLASNRAPRATAWVSLDAGDNDPVQLWSHVAMALELAGCRPDDDVTPPVAAHGGEVIAGLLPRLLRGMGELEDDLTILLDDFQVLQDPACHRQVEFLIEHLPPRAHLVIVTRADPGLRLGRLRATGQLAEIRAAELAFTDAEASALLAAEHVHLSEDALSDLIERTEGWAAGIYLAALSMTGQADPDEFVREVTGSHRFIGDYLTEEVLAAHSAKVRDFIRTVSILDRFSPSLCDVVTGSTGSARVLRDLERTNLFLVPLDESRTWFRFHPLLASVARSELELEHPELVPVAHARAARWFGDHGQVAEAVNHWLAAGAPREASRLVQASWLDYIGIGQTATVISWLDALGSFAGADPAARVPAAWMAALSGDKEALDLHLAHLDAAPDVGPLPDGSFSIESATCLIRSLFGYGGPEEMQRMGRRAVELETDGRSPFYAMAHQALGHAAYLLGDLDLAVALLDKAAQNEAAPTIIRVLALSTRSMAEEELGHPELALALAQEAMRVVSLHRLGGMLQASVAFTALGWAQLTNGDPDAAQGTVERGLVLRRKNPAQGPWGNIHHLLAAARVAASTNEPLMAQHLVEEAAERMADFSDGMEPMRERLNVIRRSLSAPFGDQTVREALTERELEVLRLLQGTVSLHEIADQLYISPNTVKTHAKAVYRKLGASSRSEAVRIARGRLLV